MCRGYVKESTTSNTSLSRQACLDSTTTLASHRIAAKMEIIAEGGTASNTRVYLCSSAKAREVKHFVIFNDIRERYKRLIQNSLILEVFEGDSKSQNSVQ